MPSIDKYQPPKGRAFVKKEYRPWTIIEDLNEEAEPLTESKPNNLKIDESNLTGAQLVSNQDSINTQAIRTESAIDIQPVSSGDSTKIQPILNKDSIETQKGTSFSSLIDDYEEAIRAIHRLSKAQRKIVYCVVDNCMMNGKLISDPLTKEYLIQSTNLNMNTIKSSIQRILQRRIMARDVGKPGEGGFSIFKITEAIRRVVVEEIKKTSIGIQSTFNRDAITSLSSSNNIKNITTTTQSPNVESFETLPQEWDDIDISPLADINFSKHHLKQLCKQGKLSSEEVQDSINGFSFDIVENGRLAKINGDPIHYFMGILKKGYPFTPPKNYISPKERAMNEYLTFKRQEKERLLKMEEETQEFAFSDWASNLNEMQIAEIIPEKKYQEEPFRTGFLKDYFKVKIWPLRTAKF